MNIFEKPITCFVGDHDSGVSLNFSGLPSLELFRGLEPLPIAVIKTNKPYSWIYSVDLSLASATSEYSSCSTFNYTRDCWNIIYDLVVRYGPYLDGFQQMIAKVATDFAISEAAVHTALLHEMILRRAGNPPCQKISHEEFIDDLRRSISVKGELEYSHKQWMFWNRHWI